MKRLMVLLALLGLTAFGLSACGGNKETTTGTTGTTTAKETAGGGGGAGAVEVSEKEYSISPSPSSRKAGTVTFTAKNDGALAHNLWVIETDKPAGDLPVKNSMVDSSAAGLKVIGKTPTYEPGSNETLKVKLKPGNYVLVCNVSGHYQAGMREQFTVT